MPKTKQKKQEILKSFKDKLATAKAVVFAKFTGLTVKDITDLRNKCRKEGVFYGVAKKTLLKKALDEAGFNLPLDGEIAVAFSEKDEVAAAKILDIFAKDHEQVKFLSGILENKILTAEEVKGLAKLPSKKELLAKMVGSIQAPVSGFVNVLAGNLRGLANVLNAIKNQKTN
ncbi:MAG: 50S ribosomal protein L10 [Patescibacteria group bacterium]|nr:50S ribosomal protein L10 [Patescibacteria group bacterium]MDD5490370.1 50S ribosomal protein L10 [Patescibacteria group bacterium]